MPPENRSRRCQLAPAERAGSLLLIASLLTNLGTRLREIFAVKVAVFLVLLITLNALYFAPQWYPVRAALEMPRLPVDHAIPFSQWWVPAYWSFYPLIVLGGIFLTTREEMRRFMAGMLGQAFVACAFFFAWPTMVSRPAVPDEAWAYHLVIALDHPVNACPSLHASFAVYCAIILNRVLRSAGAAAALRAAVWAWVALIFASTIGLRQHVALDLAAGTLLALLVLKMRPTPYAGRSRTDAVSQP